MDNNYLISIVLTTYKRSHLLLECVNSVLTGSYQNFELIIVNDCSPDDTDVVVRGIADERVRYISLDRNVGVLAARNRGFDAATGDIITILDDDDLLVPDALEQAVAFFSRLAPEERGILWFDCMDKESGSRSGVIHIEGAVVRFEDYLCGCMKGDFWLVFAREVLEKQRFDERLRAHESLFWLKLHRVYPARYFPIVLCVKRREHGERLCDLQVRLAQLPQILLAMEEFERQFGPDLKRISPVEYGRRLAYLGLHQLISGEYKAGRKSIFNSLQFKFSPKYALLYLISFVAGTRFIKELYIVRERNS